MGLGLEPCCKLARAVADGNRAPRRIPRRGPSVTMARRGERFMRREEADV